MIKPLVVRSDPDNFCVELSIRSRDAEKAVRTLELLGVSHVGKDGGPGWILGDGAISISGHQAKVLEAIEKLRYRLYGPTFKTGLDVKARIEKGALV